MVFSLLRDRFILNSPLNRVSFSHSLQLYLKWIVKNLFFIRKPLSFFRLSPVFLILLSFNSLSSANDLSCPDIYMIQAEFLKHHVLHKKLTSTLKNRVVTQFIDEMDPEKIYFLKSDVQKIKKNYKRFFKDIENNNCKELYKIYDIYSKRVNERMKFAKDYLSSDFTLDQNITYVIDDDLKEHPVNTNQANQKMIQYIQYQIANMFLFEPDLKKAASQFSFILNNINKKLKSWKPVLNAKEKRVCREKSRNSFKFCKPGSWYSFYLDTYSKSLDSHSSFMDNSDMEEFHISMNLGFEGIGATLSSRFGYTVVGELTPGGAAEKSKKIKEKDKILAVGQNSKNLVNIFGESLEDVVSIIRGKKGTPVYLKISRKQENKEKNKVFIVKLIRRQIELKEKAASISYHNLKRGEESYKIGLIQVPSFYGSNFLGKSVSRDVKKLLIQANKKKIDSLVLDLSYNRGGSLDEAVYLSGLFFSKGNVVKQSERDHQTTQQTQTDKNSTNKKTTKQTTQQTQTDKNSTNKKTTKQTIQQTQTDENFKSYIFKDRDERVFYNKPLVILVNRMSASASEIVSGALQDYKRAVIVGGDHTFGKGSVQSVQPIGNLGALRTTIGLYFIPSGKSTQKTGIQSDINLPNIFSIDAIGEKNLEHVLPSKNISSFESKPEEIFHKNSENNWKSINKQMIEQLRSASLKRVNKNEKFQKIKEQIVEIKEKEKNQKMISIAEVLENKDDKTKENKELIDEIEDEDKKKYHQRPDIQESLKIARDLVILQNNNLSSRKNF